MAVTGTGPGRSFGCQPKTPGGIPTQLFTLLTDPGFIPRGFQIKAKGWEPATYPGFKDMHNIYPNGIADVCTR